MTPIPLRAFVASATAASVAAVAILVGPARAQQPISVTLDAVQMTVQGRAGRGANIAKRRVIVPGSGIETTADVGRRFHTHYRVIVEPRAPDATATGSTPSVGPPYPGYLVETPASLACIYRLTAPTPGCIPDTVTRVATGGSKAIAIVDAYDLPTAAADLQTFSTQFGLPAANLQVVYAAGTQPTVDAGWALEESLDIEMAHARAPNATIALVESASNSTDDLFAAVDRAYDLVQQAGGGEVSMSFGGSEFADETALEAHFAKQGFVVFYASTGDSPGTEYPATSPNVVAVGGTATSRSTLDAAGFGAFLQETAWADAGGGLSAVFQRPSYQHAVAARFDNINARAVPDVAAVASPSTPVWVYCGTPCGAAGWYTVAGTSVASPLMAGMANKWGRFRQSSQVELTYLYDSARPSAFFNVVEGVCGPEAGYFATKGYDLCTGLGAPRSASAF